MRFYCLTPTTASTWGTAAKRALFLLGWLQHSQLLQQTSGMLLLIWAIMHLRCWPLWRKAIFSLLSSAKSNRQSLRIACAVLRRQHYETDKGQIDLSETGVHAAEELMAWRRISAPLPCALLASVSPQDVLE